ncbi:pentapeptide repeat-containing protein [Saccharopolyspora sp. NPDC002686]|uniref:pentapeptide repeat-containing protein n=1 Tax=Saccharopolyspora sp. NPDC002686 TaxID=3154541 RepID=UPI00331656DF
MGERKIGLVATICIAVVVLLGVSTALLIFDTRTTGADALRTGGLAAGSVVALYALWLNDRRRRVEEKRQELEIQRQDLDRERYALEQQRQALEDRRSSQEHVRTADERFARAVELLGNEADQVRVGALHALAGLARSNPDYTQTVLDVLCSYLRRPFDHPKWTLDRQDDEISPELHRERTVRQTAGKLITSLLPTTAEPDPPKYDLDLAAANLDRFVLAGRVVGTVRAYACTFRHAAHFQNTVFHGKLDLDESTFQRPLRLARASMLGGLHLRAAHVLEEADFSGIEVAGNADLRGVRFTGPANFNNANLHSLDLQRAHFSGEIDLRMADPLPALSLYNTEVNTAASVALPEGWKLDPLPAPNRARIFAELLREDHTHG